MEGWFNRSGLVGLKPDQRTLNSGPPGCQGRNQNYRVFWFLFSEVVQPARTAPSGRLQRGPDTAAEQDRRRIEERERLSVVFADLADQLAGAVPPSDVACAPAGLQDL